MKRRRLAIAGKPKTKKPRTPPPPRVTGDVVFPFFRRLEGFRLVSGMNAHELPFVRSNRVKTERAAVWAALGLCSPAPPFPLDVTIIRVAPGTLDTDNLAAAAKTVRDMIAYWLGVDDGKAERAGLVTWRVEQRKAGKGAYHTEIDIRRAGVPKRSPLEVLADWQAKGCPPAAVVEHPTEVF